MNKQLIIFGMAVLLICVGLSGCNEQTGDTSGDMNKVELVSYDVKTNKQQ